MNKTILIGLDGATFTILDHLMENGTMPFLKDLVEKGVRARLLSTPNPLTPPAWISMTTGRTPGNHGVFDFIWAEQRKADHYFTLYNFRDIRCETIWSIVSRSGGTAGSLNFTMMSPPPEISGYVIPGLVSWKHMRRNVFPRNLYEELKALPDFNVKELAWDFDLEKKAEQGIPEEEYENWVKFHIRREKQWCDVLLHLMKNHPCDLTSILFDGTDKILHMGWRFLDPGCLSPKPSPWEKKIRQLCLDYFRELDGFLRRIAETAGPDAKIFLASDHGFGPSWFTFRVNTWLHEKGYLAWRDIEEFDEHNRTKAKRLVDKHFVLLNWDKTMAYARSVTSNGIYINVSREPGQPGIPASRYGDFRARLIEELSAVREPATNTPVIKKIMTKEEAFPGKNNEQAPDLTLVMADHSFISIVNKIPAVVQRPEIAGTHYPEGIFIAGGPGINRGEKLEDLSIIDVTPALLYSLGLEIPSDIEGKLGNGIFEESYLKQHPCRIGRPTVSPEAYVALKKADTPSPEEEQLIFEQFKALGYME
ncbi:MAG: alkaline phosphatase family protein [Desulfobulbaceae bacterium]|nr:alkaline phosphatase family protein [Desulfobulbaceae bacterium]